MPSQKIFGLNSCQTQHFRNLQQCQSLFAVTLQSQGFQRATRNICTRFGKLLGDLIWDSESNFHIQTLT